DKPCAAARPVPAAWDGTPAATPRTYPARFLHSFLGQALPRHLRGPPLRFPRLTKGATMAAESHGFDLIPTVALLGAAVVAVPIFKRLGLGSVLGYLAAGLVIGPFGIGLFTDPASILHVAEL